jgi:hypothetical protein
MHFLGRSRVTNFLVINRPDLETVELRCNWINPAAIAMVVKQQRGNALSVKIHWTSGQTTSLNDQAAKFFLDKWEIYYAST